jgi:hypothetical protein
MDLLREWRRRLLGGAAAAVTVPIAIVGAALAVGVGGFGGLGALGQALTGPQVPTVEPLAAGGRPTAEDAGRLLTLAAADAAGVAAERAEARPAPARRRSTRRPGSGGRPQATPTPRPTRPTGGNQPSATPQPQPGPQPTPTEPPSTIRQTGDTVKEVTDQVPVAGEPAGQVIDLIVDTAEQLPLP